MLAQLATIIGRYPVCPRGCTSCSPVNGCVTCESRYFMFLYRQNMRQVGICTPSCPLGYYGVRHQYYSTCNRCHIDNCQACFSRHYCTRCQEPFLAFQGQCLEHCPEGLYYANYSKNCQESVNCMTGPWSEWSECSRDGRTCGSRGRGTQTKTRQILQLPSPNGQACPNISLSQPCRVARRCNDDEDCERRNRQRNRLRKRKRKKTRKRKRGRKKWNRRRNKTRKNRRGGRRRDNSKRKTKKRGQRGCRDRPCRSSKKRHKGCPPRRRAKFLMYIGYALKLMRRQIFTCPGV
ncbi:hypothetical protein C0Q70_16562 [Pomacea canaliculata]|uniref:Uncharacterized protein n=1 Tax=Pomacea canaliculata TaxID=400727 RepID=A0A2T7NQ69_POMCA|nr:hypothetical protein C0Q70_16562 [Pomacea canaliculata]